MRTIYKYQMPFENDERTVKIKTFRGAAPLHVGVQNSRCMVWMMVDERRPPADVQFRLVFTGEDLGKTDGGWNYVGTITEGLASLVCHFFWRVEDD